MQKEVMQKEVPRPSSFKRGCGCLLMLIGAILVAAAFVFVMGSNLADKEAGERNEAEWKVYNQQIEALDSIADEAVRDSIAETLPRPYIRQGGFATMFGLFIGAIVVVIALIPLGVGTYLYAKNRKLKI